MISKVLLFGAIIGGMTYAFVKANRQIVQERALEKEEKSRWENEGGAPVSSDPQPNSFR